MDADETAAQAWDRYFLGPPPKARTPKTKAVRFSDQSPGRSYDDIIAAHQSPPRSYVYASTYDPEPFDHREDAERTRARYDPRLPFGQALLGRALEISPYGTTSPYASTYDPGLPPLSPYNAETGTWLEPQAIEQYVADVVDNRIAAARRDDQLRALRRQQILGMTT